MAIRLTQHQKASSRIRYSLKLNHCDIGPVIRGIFSSYSKLIGVAMKNYTWANGQHWKVKVNQLVSGQEGWEETFQKQIDAQIRPF